MRHLFRPESCAFANAAIECSDARVVDNGRVPERAWYGFHWSTREVGRAKHWVKSLMMWLTCLWWVGRVADW